MNKIKQEKAVTLIMLTLTIIVLLILAGVAINMGTYNVDSTLDIKLDGELKMVQNAVFQQYAKYKTTLDNNDIITGSKTYSNEEITNLMKSNYNVTPVYTVQENDDIYKKYYLLNPENLAKIGIEDSEYSYIVNYYTGEVMNNDTYTTSNGTPLYVKGLSSTEQMESF